MIKEIESHFNRLKSIAKNAKTEKTLKFVIREANIRIKKYKKFISADKLNSYYKSLADIVEKQKRALKW